MSIAVASSVESLPSNPAARVRFSVGTGFVSFVCILYCVVSYGVPDIVSTIHLGRLVPVHLSSVLVHSLLLPLQAFDPLAFGL